MRDISLKINKRRAYARSSSFLMALLFTILCGTAALSLGYFINYFAKGNMVHSTQAILDSEIKYIEALDAIPTGKHNERLYLPLKKDGHLPKDFPSPSKRLAEGLLVFEMPDTGQRFAARIHTFPDGRKILVGVNITEISNDFAFMQWLGIASIALVMIVVFVSYLISIFVVSGTNKIAETAHEIIRTGDLSRRVAIASHWDDLSNMAGVLNMLLDRIQALMQGVRQVSDNIAHDLRTPLTRMRSRIETLQTQEPDNETYDQLLVESDQILATFNALLRISRIEAEQQRSQFGALALHDVLRDVVEFYEPLAEDKNITLKVILENIEYHGDRDLLFQAFANLLDNAVKFTPDGGSILLELKKDNGRVHIVINDSGPGVPDGETKKIFERFYRAEKSRSLPGAGLGLSLVSAVISLHGGSVEAQNVEGLRIITIL